jgi:hypothetical protein
VAFLVFKRLKSVVFKVFLYFNGENLSTLKYKMALALLVATIESMVSKWNGYGKVLAKTHH